MSKNQNDRFVQVLINHEQTKRLDNLRKYFKEYPPIKDCHRMGSNNPSRQEVIIRLINFYETQMLVKADAEKRCSEGILEQKESAN